MTSLMTTLASGIGWNMLEWGKPWSPGTRQPWLNAIDRLRVIGASQARWRRRLWQNGKPFALSGRRTNTQRCVRIYTKLTISVSVLFYVANIILTSLCSDYQIWASQGVRRRWGMPPSRGRRACTQDKSCSLHISWYWIGRYAVSIPMVFRLWFLITISTGIVFINRWKKHLIVQRLNNQAP